MKQFGALVRYLRANAPPLLPVRAYLRNLRGDDAIGLASLRRDSKGRALSFVVHIHNGASWPYVRMVLLHEWAHCLAWQDGHDTVDDHGPEWALAFGRLYQITVEL